MGGAGNDTFNALTVKADGSAGTTLSAFDSIDGGAGKDTLNIYNDGTNNTSLPTSASVKNVEVINIFNTAAAFNTGTANILDAAKFVGAEQIWQSGSAAAVTGLAGTTTAGFRGQNALTATPLSVTAATTATTVTVALDKVTGTVTTNDAFLNVAGAGVNTVTVAGTLAQTTVNKTAANLKLTVTGSTTATSFALNTAVDTALTLTGMTAVTTVDASAGAGGVTFDGTTQVQNFTTGAGKDVITSAFATTLTKGVSISTGAGNDTINVSTTGTGTTTVDAGAGNDTINVVKAAGNKLNIQAGAGDDTVVLSGAALSTTDIIDGGDGIDTISVGGSATARTDDDFIVFNSLLKNFETLKLSSAEGTTLATGLNVAKLGAGYTTIDFAAASFADNVGTQALVANGVLNAEAAGYKTAAESLAAGGANAVVYAGALSITEKVTGTVTATAESVALTVDASKAAVTGTLAGDVKTATVNLVQGVNDMGTVATTDDVLFAGKAVVTNSATVLTNMTSLKLTGNGAADVTNVATTKLVTVDASGLNSVDIAGKATAGLTYLSSNAAAETIILGGGIDNVTLNASKYGAVNAKTFDTVTGLNLVMDGTTLAATSDIFKLGAASGSGAATGAFLKFTTTQTDLDLALKDAAIYKVAGTDANNLVFQLGGDTYVYSDVGVANEVDAADVLVKLTGSIDLDALVASLGTIA